MLAVSVGVGVTQIAWPVRLRLGIVFTVAELLMQVAGYSLGTGAGQLLGEVATYGALVLLALVGVQMIHSSVRSDSAEGFNGARGAGLAMTSFSISLDSLGVGIALPVVGIPLIPLLIMLSITTSVFTFIGLAFGARLGERYEHGAERLAGIMLITLAVLFLLQHQLSHSPI